MDVGPVLHPDDAVANKMGALFSRAYPRDFIDIDAALSAGYTRQQLLELAVERDAGFTPGYFAVALGRLDRIEDTDLVS